MQTLEQEQQLLLPVNTGAVRVAYFSMEIALDSTIPTDSGGLGVPRGRHSPVGRRPRRAWPR